MCNCVYIHYRYAIPISMCNIVYAYCVPVCSWIFYVYFALRFLGFHGDAHTTCRLYYWRQLLSDNGDICKRRILRIHFLAVSSALSMFRHSLNCSLPSFNCPSDLQDRWINQLLFLSVRHQPIGFLHNMHVFQQFCPCPIIDLKFFSSHNLRMIDRSMDRSVDSKIIVIFADLYRWICYHSSDCWTNHSYIANLNQLNLTLVMPSNSQPMNLVSN